MPVTVFASKCHSFDSLKKRVEERRAVIENARNMNLTRLHQDVERIARRETEFAKQVLEEIVPFKLVWDETAWEKVREVVPIRVVPNKSEPEPPVTEDKTEETI